MPDWYYAKAGKQFGPVSAAQLRQMAQAGELVPDDLVFQEGGTQWVQASTVKGLFGHGTAVRGNATSRETERASSERASERAPPDDRGEEDEPPPRRAAGPGKRSYFVDLLLFRRLIAPTIIQIMFWLGVASVLLSSLISGIGGLVALVNGNAAQGLGIIVLSILYIPFGILVTRLWCEMLILFFRMNETLTDIKDTLERNQKKE